GGVVLVGGDIHRTRVLKHPTKDVAGYDVVELITSPLANTILESNKIDDPALVFDRGVEQSFLRLSHGPSPSETLRAEFVGADGATFFAYELRAADLRAG